MATVHLGRLSGPIGFSRVVAIKRMHKKLARDPGFVAMFVDEATLASRVAHPNVVATLDIVVEEGEIFLVMDYVRGQSLSALLATAVRAGAPVPVPIATSILSGVLAGLHAAHEARDKHGQPLGIVHRDVSPHNVLVGTDGVARIMDFGVAKAERRLHVEATGEIVGKPSYMAPEQILGQEVDRRTDVFAAGVVMWSMLAGRRLFRGEDHAILNEVLHGEIPPISSLRPDVSPALEAAIGHALLREPTKRPSSARAFALEIEAAAPIASATAVGAWVEALAGALVGERETLIAQIEDSATIVPRAALLEVSASIARARAEARETVPDRGPAPPPAPAPPAPDATDAAVTRLMPVPSDPGTEPPRRGLSATTVAAAALVVSVVLSVAIWAFGSGPAPADAPAGAAPVAESAPAGSGRPGTEEPPASATPTSATPAPASADPGASASAGAAPAPSAAVSSGPASAAAAGTGRASSPTTKPPQKPPSRGTPAKPGDDLGYIPKTHR